MTDIMSELIQRYLTILDVPEDEWPRQGEKLSKLDAEELRSRLESIELIYAATDERIQSGRHLWESEERKRQSLISASSHAVREWLENALLQAGLRNPDAFAPFQDQVRTENATDELYRLYLSIPRRLRQSWTDAIVDLTGEALAGR